MTKKIILRIFSFLMVLTLVSCGLPEVTPPIETLVPTETPSFSIEPTATIAATEIPTVVPVEINSDNVTSLSASYKSAVNNVQQIFWASDSLSLALTTQNFDTDGAQLFGVTTLNAPDLSPKSIFSTQEGRISAISSDGKIAALISQDLTSYSLIDLGAKNNILRTVSPGFQIANVTFSSDMKDIAVTQFDEWEVLLYDFESGEEKGSLTGFETAAPVFNAGFAVSPQWMVWIARGTILLQERESGTLGPKFEHEDFVSCYALTQDGTILASAAGKSVDGNYTNAVTLWDAAQGTELKTLTFTESVNALSFSANGQLLAVGSGKTLQVWDTANGKLLVTVEGHTDQVNAVAFSPDGKYIATSGADNQLNLWSVTE